MNTQWNRLGKALEEAPTFMDHRLSSAITYVLNSYCYEWYNFDRLVDEVERFVSEAKDRAFKRVEEDEQIKKD